MAQFKSAGSATAAPPWRQALRQYGTALSGSVGRLVFSLIYFVVLANALSIADFGVFAAASATGVMLSRIIGLGFGSPLYRIAAVKKRLLGVYTAGFLAFALASLPIFALAAAAAYMIAFATLLSPLTFAAIVCAEALVWRLTEIVITVNNGLNRFGRGSALTILGTALRAAAAALFAVTGGGLGGWVWHYLGANLVALAIAVAFFFPRVRLRFAPKVYWRRMSDSLAVCGAEMVFYLQMELDKVVVLAAGGAQLAGVYAILMRLIDLTAIPVRTFNMMLVQKLMRTPEWIASLARRFAVEAGIFTVSTLAMIVGGGLLWLKPDLLGGNVTAVAPLVILALAVPGFRNLIEYHAELLYARGRTWVRALNLALLAGAKAVLLLMLLGIGAGERDLTLWLNALFGALFVLSLVLTHAALRLAPKRV